MDVPFKTTTSFLRHYHAPEDAYFVISQGGTRSGKTYSIISLLVLICLLRPNQKLVISIVAETFPILKRGPIRDFINILNDINLWDENNWSKSESMYNLLGNTIEFFSVEQSERVKGPTRDYLFINEANNVKYETAFHLIARTRKRTYIDYNPVGEFWVHNEIMSNPKYKYHFIKTTFRDNEYLEQAIIDNILTRAEKDPNYKRVYIDGDIGLAEGVIFSNIHLIDSIPDEIKEQAKKQWIGLDWGHSDPASINNIYILGSNKYPIESVYVDELLYQTGLLNRDLAKTVKNNIERPHYEVIADSSEPKSITELELYGLNIKGADKPQGSVNYGIDLLRGADIYITKNSINTIKEFRNYKWATDRNGEPLKDNRGRPVPIDLWNHSIDNIRYCAFMKNEEKFTASNVPRTNVSSRKGMVAF